jgi:hypothetical protein
MLKHLQRNPVFAPVGGNFYLQGIKKGGNTAVFKTNIHHRANYLGDTTTTAHYLTSIKSGGIAADVQSNINTKC